MQREFLAGYLDNQTGENNFHNWQHKNSWYSLLKIQIDSSLNRVIRYILVLNQLDEASE
jgi:hypothetical protein